MTYEQDTHSAEGVNCDQNGSDAAPLRPDIPAAIDFLRRFAPNGPWVLSAIGGADKRVPTETFAPACANSAAGWIANRQAEQRNVYFLVGEPFRPLRKKADKGDMARSRWLWVDADAREDLDWRSDVAVQDEMDAIRARLEAFALAPHVVGFSGGGFQAFWRLADAFELGSAESVAAIEALTRALAQNLGGDHCHNADRIMRLPGTINFPNAKKQAKGREPILSRLIAFRERLAPYPVDAFGELQASAPAPAQPAAGSLLSTLPKGLRQRIRAAPAEGDRSEAMFGVCRALFDRGLSDNDVIEVLASAPGGVASKFAARGDLAQDVRRCRAGWSPKPQQGGDRRAPVAVDPGEIIPLMREAEKPEAFPIDALGPVLAPVAKAIASAVQVPDALAGQSVLAVAALATQGLADVEPPYGGRKPLSLFFMTIAGSGERKSSADDKALKGVQEFEREADIRHRLAMQEYAKEKREYDQAQKRSEDALYEEPAKPVKPYVKFEDVTIQSLTQQLESNQPSVGLFTSEGGKLIGGYAMSDKGKTHSAGVLNTLWDNGTADRWRTGDGAKEAIRLRGRRLTAHIMVQPRISSEFLADEALMDQGFLARWLVVSPESTMGYRLWRETSYDDNREIDNFAGRIKSLLAAKTRRALDENGQPTNDLEPEAIGLSLDAKAAWVEFFDDVEKRLTEEGDLRPISGFAAKIAEQALRIAGVLTVVERVNAGAIGKQAMLNAIALSKHYLSEAARLQGVAKVSDDLLKAQMLYDRLRQKFGDGEFGLADITRLRLKYSPSSDESQKLLTVLERHGMIKQFERKGARGHSMIRWALTPG